MFFEVIDTATGQVPDLEQIVCTQDWVLNALDSEPEGFFVTDGGVLGLLDINGNVAWPPAGRFQVKYFNVTPL